MNRFLSLFLIFCLSTGFVLCKSPQNKHESSIVHPSDSIAGFWAWFETNNLDLAKLKRDEGGAAADRQKLKEQLSKIQPGLSAIIKHSMEDTQLVITANGNAAYFPLIDNIIAKAPKIKSWKFVALIQRIENNRVNDFLDIEGGQRFRSWQTTFTAIPVKDSLDLILYIPSTNNPGDSVLNTVARNMSIMVLGEYAFGMKIHKTYGKFVSETTPVPQESKPLTEMEKKVADYYAGKK
jgi:hypothetical protein